MEQRESETTTLEVPEMGKAFLGAVMRWIRVKSGLKRNYFAPAGSLRRESVFFPDIQNVQTLN